MNAGRDFQPGDLVRCKGYIDLATAVGRKKAMAYYPPGSIMTVIEKTGCEDWLLLAPDGLLLIVPGPFFLELAFSASPPCDDLD